MSLWKNTTISFFIEWKTLFAISVNLPLAVFVNKAFGIYFKQAAVVTGHFYHVGEGVYFCYAEIGAVVENVYAFVWKIAAGFVVPVKLVGKAAQKSSTLAGNLHGIKRKVLVFCHTDGNRAQLI